MKPVAVLCVAKHNSYSDLPGVECYDQKRDARTFAGGMPVVAHPPCRAWSARTRHQVTVPESEKELGLFCAQKVIECGGILEQPAHSHLWQAAGLPKPPSMFLLPAEKPPIQPSAGGLPGCFLSPGTGAIDGEFSAGNGKIGGGKKNSPDFWQWMAASSGRCVFINAGGIFRPKRKPGFYFLRSILAALFCRYRLVRLIPIQKHSVCCPSGNDRLPLLRLRAGLLIQPG